MFIKLTHVKQSGFTLLEMVLVLFLIGLMASATLLLTEGVEDQAKYDDTKHRLSMIRTAIVGDSSRTVNGRPEISGFASDMGRLPNCLRELLTRRNCLDTVDLALWQQDPGSQVWAGWRGPYLMGNTEINGQTHFRDGYGNTSSSAGIASADWQNSGWSFSITAGAITVVSEGFDASINTDDVPIPTAIQELVVPFDYQVTLGNDWQQVNVQFYSTGLSRVIPANSLRVKINSPVDGTILNYLSPELNTSVERNGSVFLSRAFPTAGIYILGENRNIQVENNEKLEFSPKITLTGTNEITLTANTIITYTNTAGNSGQFSLSTECLPNCSLTIPTTGRTIKLDTTTVTFSALAGPKEINQIEFTSSAAVTIPAQFIEPLTVTVPNLAKSTIAVPVGTSLLANTLTLPLGGTINLTGGNATLSGTDVVLSAPQITLVGGFSRAVDTVTMTSGDVFTIPANTPAAVGNTLTISASSLFIAGEKSLTIVCETGAEQGQLFDGDCTDNVVNNTDSPESFSLIPRNTLPVNDSAIEWVIQ